MPRFYFHVGDNAENRRDLTGVDLESLQAAQSEAMRSLPAIAADEIQHGGQRQTFVVLVTNSTGQPVYSATLNYTGLSLLR